MWALDGLWRQLGIAKVVRSLLAAHRFETPVERLLFALVANRALEPSSTLAIEEWVAEEVAVQQLYRAMDFLLAAEAERERVQREATLEELRERLAALKGATGITHSKLHGALRTHATFGRWLTQDARGRLVIDERKVHEEERLDGKYILRTCDDTLSPEDVVLGYRQLYELEDAFRTFKQTLELRPVYHRKEQRIRAHVLLCWLGLLLIRVAEVRTGKTWRRLRPRLQRIRLGSFVGAHGSFRQRSELSQEQKGIYAALALAKPPLLAEPVPAARQNAAATTSGATSDQPAA